MVAGHGSRSADVFRQLCPLHGSNKVPRRAKWWQWEDCLRNFILQLAMELLLEIIRPLPISARCSLHSLYYQYWEEVSTMLVWQDIWIVLRPGQRVEFVRRTFFFDPDFGASMLDVAYATRIANFGTLHDMD